MAKSTSQKVSLDQACLRDLQTTNPRHDKGRIETAKGGLLKDAYNWILEHADFKRWRYGQQSQLLWIRGDPGKGKTMLLCGIIDELTKSALDTTIISFFFCQGTDARINHATAVLRGLIFMLVDRQPSLISHVRRLYDKTGKQVFEDVNAWVALSEILTCILEDPLLLLNAHGTFLWVALVCEQLTGVPKRNVRKKLEEFPPGLDKLYERMLNQISDSDDAEHCKSVLSVMTTVYRPITLDELTSCIDLSEEATDNSDLAEIIRLCGSFLTLRGCTISLVHQSAKDFLHRRADDKIFSDGKDSIHYVIFSNSLQAITRILRRDIYSLVSPGYSIDQVPQLDPDPLAAIRYACVYWVNHLDSCSPIQEANEDLQDGGLVDNFFHNKYLQWLEALSLLKSLPDGIASILKLESLLKTTAEDSQLLNRVRDAYRFLLYHKTAIENHPLQVYASGLIFSPARSLTRIQFESQGPGWIVGKPTMKNDWDACLQTLEGHSEEVNSASFSHDSKLLASSSDDGTIKVWDTSGGQCLRTHKGHDGRVFSVAFSHDSELLASSSHDGTIKVWDTSGGQCIQTLKGHNTVVYSATFSHDSKLLVSASHDELIKVWDTSSGQCIQTLKGWRCEVHSVTFSHDSKLLASASGFPFGKYSIKIWDVSSGQCLQTLRDLEEVNSVTFSYDSKLLASASVDSLSGDSSIMVWDASSGKCIQTLHIEGRIYVKSFDITSSYLNTDIGSIFLTSFSEEGPIKTDLEAPRFEGYNISSDCSWITRNLENLLWLPPEYRPQSFAVSQSTICLGCHSERVLFFTFDPLRH